MHLVLNTRVKPVWTHSAVIVPIKISQCLVLPRAPTVGQIKKNKNQTKKKKKKLDTYNVKNPPKHNIHLRIQLPPLKLETKINQTIFQIMLYECGFKVKNDSQQNIDEQEWSQWK